MRQGSFCLFAYYYLLQKVMFYPPGVYPYVYLSVSKWTDLYENFTTDVSVDWKKMIQCWKSPHPDRGIFKDSWKQFAISKLLQFIGQICVLDKGQWFSLTSSFGKNLWTQEHEIWPQETRNIFISYGAKVFRYPGQDIRSISWTN